MEGDSSRLVNEDGENLLGGKGSAVAELQERHPLGEGLQLSGEPLL